jgi:hypothetical protein
MPAAGAYVVVDGQTYRVLDQTLDDVTGSVQQALDKGSVLSLNVAATHNRAEDMGTGRLYLHGAQLASVAVLSGPLPATGHPATF